MSLLGEEAVSKKVATELAKVKAKGIIGSSLGAFVTRAQLW